MQGMALHSDPARSSMNMEQQPIKPLGQKGYGTIPHLPGSRRGPGDKGVNEGQFRICCVKTPPDRKGRSEEHTSELQSRFDLVCRLLLEKKKKKIKQQI